MWQLLAFTSAIFSSLAAVFEKKALFKTEPLVFSLLLSALTFVLALPFFFFANLQLVTGIVIAVLYVKSILGAVAFLMIMNGLKTNELSNSLPLLTITPAVVALLAYCFLKESLSLISLVGILLVMAGTYLLQLPKGEGLMFPLFFLKRNKNLWYFIIAILLFSLTSILDKSLLKSYKMPPEAFLPLQQLFLTLNFFIIFLMKKKNSQSVKEVLNKYYWIILLVASFAIVYRYMHILAVKNGSVALVLSIKRTSVFFAAIIAGNLFKEHDLLRRSLAILIMLLGAAFVILSDYF